jgi:hypothetical protein
MRDVCGVTDTACTNNERFEQPWQPLKGISFKNIYVPELSHPTTTKHINLKGLPNKKVWLFAFKIRSYLGEFEAEFKKALVNQGHRVGCNV